MPSPDLSTLMAAAVGAVPQGSTRDGQVAMATAVRDAFAGGEHLLVQAGTGTGKSLAYLVPALAHDGVVVVATATKALQAQLVDTDLPRLVDALAPVLGRRPTFALAKGRSNYVCLHAVHEPGAADLEQQQLVEAPTSVLGGQVRRLREWSSEAVTGDREEVPFAVDDRAWQQVSVSAQQCLGTRCPYREDCFAEKARELAREADVVVANHALLALDAMTEAPVLPEHVAVVVDEAHELAASVTEALSLEVSAVMVERAVRATERELDEVQAAELAAGAAPAVAALSALGSGWLQQLPVELADALGALASAGRTATARLDTLLADGTTDDTDRTRRERLRAQLDGVVEAADAALQPGRGRAVYAHDAGQGVRLRVSPLAVGHQLASGLLDRATTVATSATLSLGGSFLHPALQLGLRPADGRPATGAEVDLSVGDTGDPGDDPAATSSPSVRPWRYADVGSPFDYPRQGQLHVATYLPDPGREPQAWAGAVDDLLVELAEAAGGRMLGLFSSRAAAARAAASLRARTDLTVLLQGEDSPGALTHAFAADPRSCLLGTRTFWQGVDVPGSACQLVVVDRIPFGHRDDPLTLARQAAADQAGRSGFSEVVVPAAAVLLAQGVGRLIRSAGDRGVVVVCDPRLERGGYSRLLLRTLPPFFRARDKERVLASLRAIDADAPPVRDPGPAPSARRAAAALRSAAQAASRASAGARDPGGRDRADRDEGGEPGGPAEVAGSASLVIASAQPRLEQVKDAEGWSPDDDALLRNGVAAGRSAAQLAERHEVSESQVRGRVARLGLRLADEELDLGL